MYLQCAYKHLSFYLTRPQDDVFKKKGKAPLLLSSLDEFKEEGMKTSKGFHSVTLKQLDCVKSESRNGLA
jgi:hypothetical protein